MHRTITFWSLVLGITIGIYILVVPKTGGHGPRTLVAATKGDISRIETALGQYQVDNGSFPKGFADLVQKPSGATNWHGPYFDPPKNPIDPWGDNYIYEFPGRHNVNSYDLMSAGPDGKAGTEDDIVNWTK